MNGDRHGVMIGVLRNRKQLKYNLDYRFYHIPEEWVTEEKSHVKYIALYQSTGLFSRKKSGVFYYGKVIGKELVPRREIANIPTIQDLNKKYYRFFVEEWLALERPILSSEKVPDVNLFVSEERFFSVCNVAELFIRDEYQWEMYQLLRKKFDHVRLLGIGDKIDAIFFAGYYLEWRKRSIVLARRGRVLMRIKKDTFNNNVECVFNMVCAKINKRIREV